MHPSFQFQLTYAPREIYHLLSTSPLQKTYGDAEGSDWAGEDIDLTADGGAIVAVDNGSFGFLKISPF